MIFSGYKYINCTDQKRFSDLLLGRDETQFAYTDLFDILKQSPTASCLMEALEDADLSYTTRADLNLDEALFHETGTLLTLPDLKGIRLTYKKNQARLLNTLSGILRYSLQRHARYHDRFDLKPFDYLMFARIVAADISAVHVQIAWELRTAGYLGAWRQVLTSSIGDMAVIFTNHLKADPMGALTGKALKAAFRQWYADQDRVNKVDYQTLLNLDVAVNDFYDERDVFQSDLIKDDISVIESSLPFAPYLQNIDFVAPWFSTIPDIAHKQYLNLIEKQLK